MKDSHDRRRRALLLVLLIAACSPTRGCLESSFELSSESRLPKWFASSGVPRADATVTMDYYIGGDRRTATFTLRNRGRKVATVDGQMRGKEPTSFVPHGDTGPIPYPLYEVITVDRITEVIVHRRRDAVFDIADDPEVRRRLGVP